MKKILCLLILSAILPSQCFAALYLHVKNNTDETLTILSKKLNNEKITAPESFPGLSTYSIIFYATTGIKTEGDAMIRIGSQSRNIECNYYMERHTDLYNRDTFKTAAGSLSWDNRVSCTDTYINSNTRELVINKST